jgi:NAD(P)-dependent dehydrogenase (short-subunit alcohol dehydrogenase family)
VFRNLCNLRDLWIGLIPHAKEAAVRLKDKVVIVTGASTGMGRAIALALAREGARLALVARSADPLDAVTREARTQGGDAVALPGDVADAEFAKGAVEQVARRFGRIDALVNNAGTNTFHRNLADISVADWHRVLETNLTGAFLFTRYALPHMRAAGAGQIVTISSGAGLQASPPAGVAYSASKHALHSLSGSINAEERCHGIRACVIAPGETDTPNLSLRPRRPGKADLANMLQPADIAAAVAYVLTQPPHVAVELLVINPTVRRNYQADYDAYVAEGHTRVELE